MSNHKKQYVSIYGALRPILPFQYLVELIIKRRADKKGIQLPNRFWSKQLKEDFEYWVKIWNYETKYAQHLFKKYDPDCIIDAFNSYDCRNILSTTNKQLEKITREFQRRKNLIESTKEKIEIVSSNPNIPPPQPTGKKSKLSKLK